MKVNMTTPKFCYEKMFWIMVTVLITSVVSTFGVMWGEVQALEDQVDLNIIELEKRTAPIYEQIPSIQKTVSNNHDNLLLICHELEITCWHE